MIIRGLGTALPDGAVTQERATAISETLACRDPHQQRLLRALFRRAGVQRRHSVLLPADDAPPDLYAVPVGPQDLGPGTAARMQVFEREAAPLAARAARQALGDAELDASGITHLVTVSCTGFYAPGLDADLIAALGLSPRVGRAHVGFMGCHGAFNALSLAHAIVGASPRARVLVVAVELCSLHFSYEWDAEKLVANALFADGASAFVCVAADGAAGLRAGPFGSVLMPDSRQAMSWRIGDHGFAMTLSAAVPELIRRHVPEWLNGWLGEHGGSAADVSLWAVHPGGPRILDAFEAAMQLPPAALQASREVLAMRGNMSSATVGFILDALRRSGSRGEGVAVGFGPGLIAEAFRFRLEEPMP